jgi:hypothetical protein
MSSSTELAYSESAPPDALQENRSIFLETFREKVSRPGRDEILHYLVSSTDFFRAPASTRYHLSREGGLCRHSLNVYRRLMAARPQLKECSEESIALVSLLHDVCKAEFYAVSTRNAKDEKGKWVVVPYYTVEDKFPLGHGGKSLYIASKFMALTDDEALAIMHHMGGFGVMPGDYSVTNAFKMSRLALELHIADMRATYADEVEG